MTSFSSDGRGEKGKSRLILPQGARRMTLEDRESMLVHLMRLPTLMARAREYLDETFFSAPDEHHLRVLWLVLCKEAARRFRDCSVPYQALRKALLDYYADLLSAVKETEIRDLLDTDRDVSPPDLPGVVWHAWHEAQEGRDYSLPHGYDLVRQFYAERAIHDPTARAFTLPEGRLAGDYTALLEDLNSKARRLGALEAPPVGSLLPAPGMFRPRQLFHVDVPYLIAPMTGLCFPEICGLMGPIGGGKTTMALQIAVRMAEYFMRAHHVHGKPLRHVFFFFYELSMEEMLTRVWSMIGQVRSERFFGLTGLDDPRLTRTADPLAKRLEYERVLARRNNVDIDQFPGEYERIMAGIQMIEPVFHLIPMSGDQGFGYVSEIAAILDDHQRRDGWDPGGVFVDYAGVAARRYLHSKQMDIDRNLRHYVYGFVSEMLEKVNMRYNCCSWILHQLAGAVNARQAGARMHHSEGSETKSFAENLDFCFLLGNRDKDNNARFDYSKCRRTDKQGQFAVLRLDGDYGLTWRQLNDYTVHNGLIVPADLATQVGGELARRKEPTLRRRRLDFEEGGTPPPFQGGA